MNFFWSWEEGYPKNVCMSHDVHVSYSQVENSDSNHQFVNQTQRDARTSFVNSIIFGYS